MCAEQREDDAKRTRGVMVLEGRESSARPPARALGAVSVRWRDWRGEN